MVRHLKDHSDTLVKRTATPVTRSTVLKHKIRAFEVGHGLPSIAKMREELADYRDVLFGRKQPPINFGIMNLYEIAEAYYSRATEMTMLIQEAEHNGIVLGKSPYVKFRTGELRTFRELAKSAAELGSRRLSYEQLEHSKAIYGRSSAGAMLG